VIIFIIYYISHTFPYYSQNSKRMGSSYLYPSFFPLSRPTMTAKTLSRIAVKSCTSNMPTRGKWRNLKVNMGMELVPIYGNFMGNLWKYHGKMDGN